MGRETAEYTNESCWWIASNTWSEARSGNISEELSESEEERVIKQ